MQLVLVEAQIIIREAVAVEMEAREEMAVMK